MDATPDAAPPPRPAHVPSRVVVVSALGFAQILSWGTSFYFPAVLAAPIVADTGWPLAWVVGGTSIGLLTAGLISPRVGRIIDKHGGRPVLAASSLLHALGLAVIALAPFLPVYLIGWVLVGAAMGAGLYDATFAALGRLYGREARGPITNLTLFGGFASTVCWPLGAFLVATFDWRITALVYAGLHLFITLPLHLVMPAGKAAADKLAPLAEAAAEHAATPIAHERLIFVLVALVMTLAAGVGSVVVVHLLIFLQARGLDFAAAVSLGTLFGPAQVGARVVERLFGRHYHPVWTMIAACGLMAIGLAMLLAGFPLLALVIVLYGAGYGISWIARGTLPLALFGPERYPILMGRLAFPSLIVQALAPSAGALLVERSGVDATIAVLTALALVNVVVIAALWSLCRPRPAV
jgi:predicted MFS family arabinose efflux permease